MPNPPAAFSPLMTKSSFQSAISPCRRSSTMVRPLRPTMSPTKRMRTLSRSPAVDHFALGQHEIEPRVVRQLRHQVGLLHGVSKPHGGNRFARPQGVEREVVIAGPVPDPTTAAIEGGERYDEDIRMELGRIGFWLTDAPLSALQIGAEGPGAERERLATGDDRRQ